MCAYFHRISRRLNFKLKYESKKGTKETPIVIHRAVLGSLERFIGILIEHTAG